MMPTLTCGFFLRGSEHCYTSAGAGRRKDVKKGKSLLETFELSLQLGLSDAFCLKLGQIFWL